MKCVSNKPLIELSLELLLFPNVWSQSSLVIVRLKSRKSSKKATLQVVVLMLKFSALTTNKIHIKATLKCPFKIKLKRYYSCCRNGQDI